MKKIMFLFCLLITACSNSIKEYDYSDFQDRHIEWLESLSQKENDYFVYIYNTYCGHCIEIKQKILSFLSCKCSYLIKYTDEIPIGTHIEYTIGETDIENVFILGTPTLIKVEQNAVSENIGGKTKILERIK